MRADGEDSGVHCDEHRNHTGRHFCDAWHASWQHAAQGDLSDHGDEHGNQIGEHLTGARHTSWQYTEYTVGGDDSCDDLNKPVFCDCDGDDLTGDCDECYLDRGDIRDAPLQRLPLRRFHRWRRRARSADTPRVYKSRDVCRGCRETGRRRQAPRAAWQVRGVWYRQGLGALHHDRGALERAPLQRPRPRRPHRQLCRPLLRLLGQQRRPRRFFSRQLLPRQPHRRL
mmetsp:Transcript_91014/g.293832  ORF Transcript_91014/g.293832 Transcript_91014/m.293832 type:complete len:227 (+) Transcript_91014:97-777(+)